MPSTISKRLIILKQIRKISLKKSVVNAMDGSDVRIFPYFPYIFQDLWELGYSPENILRLIKKHISHPRNLRILDLACGKGVISISAAKRFGCGCLGIDAMSAFIKEARKKAKEQGVQQLCRFEVGDIRKKINTLNGFDIAILGSVGPVFGCYQKTLTAIAQVIDQRGWVVLDDGYISDRSKFKHPMMQKRCALLIQIKNARMRLVDEIISSKKDQKKQNEAIFSKIQKRCFELSDQYPKQRKIFCDYIKAQEEENNILINKIVCSTMLLRRIK